MQNSKNQKSKKGSRKGPVKKSTGMTRGQSFIDKSNFQEVVVIPRSLGWAPRRVRASLLYHAFGVVNNVGIAHANVRYTPTYAYDIDPLLASTAMPGFTEWGAIYRFYRTHSSSIRVTFSNKEAFPITSCICPVNFDPTANTASFANYFSSRLSKTAAAGPLTGNGVNVLQNSFTTADIGGVASIQTLDSYCAQTSGAAAPGNNWYWFVGILTDGSLLVNGVFFDVALTVDVEFFELQSPSA
jgi:hypothetical protein